MGTITEVVVSTNHEDGLRVELPSSLVIAHSAGEKDLMTLYGFGPGPGHKFPGQSATEVHLAIVKYVVVDLLTKLKR